MRMTPSAPQVPLVNGPDSTSLITTAGPSGRSKRFNLSSVKKASDWLSGDQNTDTPPSVPASGHASRSATGRIQTLLLRGDPDADLATNANCNPFGDNAKEFRPGWSSKRLPAGG